MNNINNEKLSNTTSPPNTDISPSIDYIFFVRRKKSFRYLIFSIIILTFCLWFSDRYLRFDLDETKYRVALTLEKESARPIMRNVATKIISNPNLLDDPRYLQYLEYLALIEEDDAVTKLYQDIYNIGNINSSFLSNYAIKLYFLGEYNKARELLREAQNLPPNNSLLGYLESAMIISSETTDEKIFVEGISIIAKENRSGNPVIFPEPFWHDTLPRYTYSYYVQKSNILNHCLAPLYKLYSVILKRIEIELKKKNFQNKQIWLEEVLLMGKKIGMGINTDNFYSSLPLCIFSLKLQKDTLALYNQFTNVLNSPFLEKEVERISKISKLLEVSEQLEERKKLEFEYNRKNRIKIIGFIFLGLIELSIIYLIGKSLYFLLSKANSEIFVLKIPKTIYFFIGTWFFIIFIFLLYSLYFDNIPSNYIIYLLWCLLIISPFFAGTFLLFNKKIPSNLGLIRYSFIRLAICFLEKLSGTVLGVYILLICVLFLAFRILYFSYPFQLNLIWDTTRTEEFNFIKEFLSFIHS